MLNLLIYPGEVLLEDFMKPYGLSANRLAKALGIPTNRVTAIINGTRGITGETAVLLGGHSARRRTMAWLAKPGPA